MNTPPKGKRRDDHPELKARYAQKTKPTKAQRRLAARQLDYETNLARINGQNGYSFIKPGSNN